MTAMKRKTKATTRYTIEWCSEIPEIDGEREMGLAKYVREHFATEQLAIARANELIRDGKDAFGCIRIEEQQPQVNDDILENEGRTVIQWTCQRYTHVDGPSPEDFEPWQYGR